MRWLGTQAQVIRSSPLLSRSWLRNWPRTCLQSFLIFLIFSLCGILANSMIHFKFFFLIYRISGSIWELRLEKIYVSSSGNHGEGEAHRIPWPLILLKQQAQVSAEKPHTLLGYQELCGHCCVSWPKRNPVYWTLYCLLLQNRTVNSKPASTKLKILHIQSLTYSSHKHIF